MGLVFTLKLLLCLVAFLCSCIGSTQVAPKLNSVLSSDGYDTSDSSGPVAGLLPFEEVDALATFLDDLEGLSEEPSITRYSCNQTETSLFSCNCSYPSDNQCHIDRIYLSDNQLYGLIPESLGNLPKIRFLDLSNNQFSGQIPDSLGNLSSLVRLYLEYNFLNGTIPASLGNLSSLTTLSLSFNNLIGEIPQQLGNLVNLQDLRLIENRLSGSLPNSLGNLTKLETFWVSSNKLNGKIPSTYSRLASLKSFDVAGNYLDGPIPPFIANWSNIYDLKLIGNNFDTIPREIFGMRSLRTLAISDVPSKGSDFPFPDLSALTKLTTLVLRKCSIAGLIHPSVGKLQGMNKQLDLSFNNLTGNLSSLENLTKVNMLLTGNQLTGKIPYNLTGNDSDDDLVRDFSYNNLTKDDNEKLGNFTYIEPSRATIDVQQQQCHKKKSKHTSLYINCGGDQVRSEKNIVYQADNSTSNYRFYERWGYSCSGLFMQTTYNPIPSDYIQNTSCGAYVNDTELYREARLCPISLKYYGFCLHKGNYMVTLHFRDTVFASDQDYSSYGKRVFDIYIQQNRTWPDFNIKEHVNPTNNISLQSFDTYVGDEGLLEIHLYWTGKGSWKSPTALHGPMVSAISITPKFRVGYRPWQIALIVIACLVAVLLLLLFVLWRTGWIGDRELREKSIEIRGRPYTIKQVVDATKNFSPRMELGKGKFGTVYRAELPNGPVVAVKKLSPRSALVKNQIESEVYTLKQLKHEHIVELFGGYSGSRRNLHLLVYEFMEHKSVGQVLFDPNSNLQLNWDNRYEICRGMAKGLNYLHNSRFKIIHRNIKASNILLDAMLKAKISDLGLAKLQEEENPYFAIGAGGALVYMAPEYATRKAISDKVDVYSFGVVLLEIVSGKNNAVYREGQEAEFLLDKACVLQTKGRLMDLVDAKLLSDNTYDRKQAKKVLNLAMMCVDQSHSLRPGMSQVVDVLEDNLSIEQLSKEITPST